MNFTFTIVPLKSGGLNSFPALASYKPSENEEAVTVSSNYIKDQIPIFTAERFKQLTRTHQVEKSVFYIGLFLVIVGPLLSQYYLGSKFILGVPRADVKIKSS